MAQDDNGRARGYRDLREHVAALADAGLLHVIDAPVNKDTELHALVRWQFRGGIAESERKAFLFTNVVDARGRRYDVPVVVGALAATPAIYAIGMNVPVAEIGTAWERAMANPIAPVEVSDAPCQEVVTRGEQLLAGHGLDALPVPVSTPGFDCAPYLTMTACITRDPDTGIQNMGTYRAAIRARDRLGVRMATRPNGAEGYVHWEKYRAAGEPMPCAIVVGAPPAVVYCAPQKLPMGQDELGVAGALVGQPINVVRARTVDLRVPAEAEIVIEGLVHTDVLEPEGPFGESHGHVALEDFNMVMQVTAITHKREPLFASIISQVTPSESSVIKRVAYEPLFLNHLRDVLGIKGIKRVGLHEPLTNLRRVVFLQFEPRSPTSEVWRALYGMASMNAAVGKYVIAVDEDIEPGNPDAIFWALAYRANPARDMQILPHRARGHGPKGDEGGDGDASLLVDATRKSDYPPLALPRPEFMERARSLWDELGLPVLTPESPWHGYEMGDWRGDWSAAAERAVAGDYEENGRLAAQRRIASAGVRPETPTRQIEGDPPE